MWPFRLQVLFYMTYEQPSFKNLPSILLTWQSHNETLPQHTNGPPPSSLCRTTKMSPNRLVLVVQLFHNTKNAPFGCVSDLQTQDHAHFGCSFGVFELWHNVEGYSLLLFIASCLLGSYPFCFFVFYNKYNILPWYVICKRKNVKQDMVEVIYQL